MADRCDDDAWVLRRRFDPLGGGTIAFPVLVLLFDLPGSLGRNFGLAIQSIGMTSAAIYILSSGKNVDWRLLRPAFFGSLIGTPLGAALLAPVVSDLWVKLTFGVIWASFGILHLVKLRELVAPHQQTDRWHTYDQRIGLTLGIVGGIASSITGVGIDMMLYATLVLLYRADLKVAIPTSVIIMAFTSIIGIAANGLLGWLKPSVYQIDPEVFAYWLTAAPIVTVGAPFGALVVSLISRTPTLVIVSILCLAQFAWLLIHEQVTGLTLLIAMFGVVVFNVLFHLLYTLGKRPESETAPIVEIAIDEAEG